VFIVYGLFRRIERAEAQKHNELEYQAFHDGLTGLKNRNYLQSKGAELFSKQKKCSCLLININGMKLINDIYSHHYGDDFMCRFAKRLFEMSPNGSEVIRLNGDEFLVVVSFHDFPEKSIAELKKSLEKSITIQDIVINFTISIGVAHYPKDTNDIDQLVSYADMALHAAKQDKGTIVHFDNLIKDSFIRRALIEKHIPQAINQQEIKLVYQPQIRYPDQLYGVEVLVRWSSPELGFVSPPELIGVAEASGLMPRVGEFIIDQACKEISELKKRIPISFQLSLNISAKQFMHEGFIAYLLNAVTQHQLSAKDITLELTESIFVHDIKQLVHTLHLLKAEGFKISMDDFGTGFSSLSMLRKIPLNEIKIDKSFVDDVTTDESAEYVTKTILLIANQLGYEAVIAEGAETVEQVDKLVGQGCSLFQGYYFSKPVDIQQLECYIGA
jgi:diguanylate cyclase (GGDEF)-like protein